MRFTVAISVLLVAGAIALLAAGFLDLAAYAPDGAVSAEYVAAFQLRARVCTFLLLLIAVSLRFLDCGDASRRSPRGGVEPPPTALIAILAIAALTRAWILTLPLHYDEAFTLVEYASKSPLFFLTRYTHPNNHVFHTLLAWLVPGESVALQRLPAFLAGVMLLYLTWRLGTQLHDRATGLLACAIAAGASPLVEYSAQARGYTILACCALVLYLVTPRLDAQWPIAAAAIAIGAWTIPVMIYAAAGWAAWVVMTQRPIPWRALIASAAAGAAATFVLYVPILVVTGPRSITENGNVLPVPLEVLIRELPRTLADAARHWSLSFTTIGALVLAGAALVTIVRQRGRDPFLIGLVAALALTIAMRRVPFARVWIFLLPLFAIAAARALRIRSAAILAIAIAAATSWNAVRVTSGPGFFADEAMRDAPAIARLAPHDGQVLITTHIDAPLAWYLRDRNDIVVFRFDSDPVAVRNAFRAPKRYLIASRHPGGLDAFRRLGIGGTPVPLHVLEHAAVYEIR